MTDAEFDDYVKLGRQVTVIEDLNGGSVVQAEGKVTGRPFYFRARFQRWQFALHPRCDGDPLDVWEYHQDCSDRPCPMSRPMESGEFYREEPWGEGPFDAGYMDFDVAERFIYRCAGEYYMTLQEVPSGSR